MLWCRVAIFAWSLRFEWCVLCKQFKTVDYYCSFPQFNSFLESFWKISSCCVSVRPCDQWIQARRHVFIHKLNILEALDLNVSLLLPTRPSVDLSWPQVELSDGWINHPSSRPNRWVVWTIELSERTSCPNGRVVRRTSCLVSVLLVTRRTWVRVITMYL